MKPFDNPLAFIRRHSFGKRLGVRLQMGVEFV